MNCQNEMKELIIKKKLLLLAIAMLPFLPSHAQGDDLGSLLGVEMVKKLDNQFRLDLSVEMRTRDDMSDIDRLSADLGARWEVLPWLHLSGGYVFIVDQNKRISHYKEGDREVRKGMAEVGDRKNLREFWGVRNRAYASFTASREWGRVKLSLRERWQYTYRAERIVDKRYNYVYKRSDNAPRLYHGDADHVLRSRLTLTYKPQAFAAKPYASMETFHSWELKKIRYTLGAEWKINKHHSLDAFYRYQYVKNHDENDPNRHIIGLNWQVKI